MMRPGEVFPGRVLFPMRLLLLLLGLSTGLSLGAERRLDFADVALGKTPPGFRSTFTGLGPPGEWQVLMDRVPPLLAPISSNAPIVASKAVLGQTSQTAVDEHFPLLVLDDQTYRDFKFTTRFKTVGGKMEQMAGIAFRIQDETNYYVVRASSLGNTFRFYKVVNGQRGQLYGPQVPIPSGAWHELSVECQGNQIRCSLNGQQIIPTLTDSTFASGKIGFWTKSDSITYFSDPTLVYTPIEPPAQVIVRETLSSHDRLLGLKIFVKGAETGATKIIAAKDESEVGSPGGAAEWDVIQNGNFYYGKGKKLVAVTMPLRDRNGDIIAATRVEMTTFSGQTEKNAVERAAPIVRDMQRRIQRLQDLVE